MKSCYAEWSGQPARVKGRKFPRSPISPPIWAYCDADMFDFLYWESVEEGTTLAEKHGEWDYSENVSRFEPISDDSGG